MSDRLKMRMLEKELEPYSKVLTQAAGTIVDSDVSRYPIFVVHQHQMDMGIPLIDKEQFKGNWSVNASSLEEFVTKNIIEQEKIDGFRTVYKKKENALQSRLPLLPNCAASVSAHVRPWPGGVPQQHPAGFTGL